MEIDGELTLLPGMSSYLDFLFLSFVFVYFCICVYFLYLYAYTEKRQIADASRRYNHSLDNGFVSPQSSKDVTISQLYHRALSLFLLIIHFISAIYH